MNKVPHPSPPTLFMFRSLNSVLHDVFLLSNISKIFSRPSCVYIVVGNLLSYFVFIAEISNLKWEKLVQGTLRNGNFMEIAMPQGRKSEQT